MNHETKHGIDGNCNCIFCKTFRATREETQRQVTAATNENQLMQAMQLFRLEREARDSVPAWFASVHPKLLGNSTIDAIVDNCMNLPEVVAYVAAASELTAASVAAGNKSNWLFTANKFVKAEIANQLRSFINKAS